VVTGSCGTGQGLTVTVMAGGSHKPFPALDKTSATRDAAGNS